MRGIFIFLLLDVKGISPLQLHNLIVFLPPVLGNQVDLVLEREQEENSLLSRHPLHVHIVHLQNLVPGLQSLLGCRRSRLDGSHEDSDLVTTRETDSDAASLLERYEPGIRPEKGRKIRKRWLVAKT